MVRPGPGSYLHYRQASRNLNRSSSPAWGFNTSSRSISTHKQNSSPGPGAYIIPPKLGLVEQPRPAIGNAARSTTYILKMATFPSPFSYNTSAEYTINK